MHTDEKKTKRTTVNAGAPGGRQGRFDVENGINSRSLQYIRHRFVESYKISGKPPKPRNYPLPCWISPTTATKSNN